jgi:hypothetical protein
MKKLSYSLFITVITLVVTDAAAQTNKLTTTAVPFLRIATDAKSSGMASMGIATPADASALFYNISKLPFAKENGSISANYSPWLKEWAGDMYLASFGGYHKLNDNEAIHGLIRYFNPGDLQFTDNSGNHLQSYHPNEFSVDLGYSRKLSDKMGLGLSVKYIRSDLGKGSENGETFKAGNSIAADLGFYYDLRNENEEGFSFGAQLSNLGSKMSYTKSESNKALLPANLGLGASYTKVIDEENKIILGLDLNKLLVPVAPNDSTSYVKYSSKSVVSSWSSSFSGADQLKTIQVSLGAEYWYKSMFAIRAGYFYEDKSNGSRNYLSAGASIKYNLITANFAYLVTTGNSTIKNPLNNTLLFGIAINLK